MSNENGYPTTQAPEKTSSEYNSLQFVFDSLMAKRHFAEPVEVVSVEIPDGLNKAGRVSVKPLINMLDAQGNSIPHGKISNLIYFRLQGGANAFVIDPKVGDKGMAIFTDRDMSSVKANEGAANPGSARRSSWSDGWYIGGLLNGVPEQYVYMHDDGIDIVSPNAIKLQAPNINVECETLEINAESSVTITGPNSTVNGVLHVTGAITSDTSVTAPTVTGTSDVIAGGISGKLHKHQALGATAITTSPLP